MASSGSGRVYSTPGQLKDEVIQKFPVDEYDATGFDDILEAIKPRGRFQKRFLYGLVCPMSIIYALGYIDIFMLFIPDHWCHDPNWRDQNYSNYDEWKNYSIPKEIGADGTETFSKCEIYINPRASNGNITASCPYSWEYDRSELTLTIPSEFNWVCSRQKYTTYVFTTASIAGIFGTLVLGPATDRFGRKRMFMINIILYQVASIAKLFSPGFFGVYLTVIACSCFVSPRAPIMILFELSDSKFRSWTSATDFIVFVIGMSAVPAIAYLLADWFYMGIATVVPRTIVLICLLCFVYIPESPRWLTSVGRVSEAKSIIQQVAKTNGTSDKLTDEQLQTALCGLVEDAQYKESSQSGPGFIGFFTILSKPRLAKNTILLSIVRAVNSFVYGGITLNTPYMPWNQFVTFFILAIVEVPASIAGGFAMQVVGRRWTPVAFFFVSASTCLCAAWNIESAGIVTACIIISKFAVNLNILVSEVQVVEIFPTPVRATGSSFVSLVIQLLSIGMPSIVNMGREDASIPYIAFGICSLIGMICASLLPETLNQPLPESVAEANHFGKHHPFWSFQPKREHCSKDRVIE